MSAHAGGTASQTSSPSKGTPSTSPLTISTGARTPSAALSYPSSSLSSSFEPLSSAEVLERVPTSVVRLLAALAPLIYAANRFVRLATWTGGPGSYASSVLLLISWWLLCSFGYELIRYAPQAIILGYMSYAWVRKQLTGAKNAPAAVYDTHDVVSAASINATIRDLSELVDFCSQFRRSVLVPVIQLLSWHPHPARTKAVAAFLVITWPMWLASFLPWDKTGLPSVVLPVSGSAITASVCNALAAAKHYTIKGLGPNAVAAIKQNVAPGMEKWHALQAFVARTRLPAVYHHLLALLSRLQVQRYSGFAIRVLPPYPIAALSVRSLLCLTGTLAFTWCAPWCALMRQAIWKSATIRRLVRGTGRALSGQKPFSEAYGRGNLDDEWNSNQLTHDAVLRASASKDKNASARSSDNASGKRKTEASRDRDSDSGVTRHEDVMYQFSIFENQRWWMGLDWTAALLPQERPSWSDEASNPVSPPSSFSLPPARVTLTPAPTSSNPKAYNRRTIKWQWLDPEWTIAGASHTTCTAAHKGSCSVTSAKEAAIASAKTLGDQEALDAAKQGYLGVALDRIRKARGASLDPEAIAGPPTEDEEWDVDIDGWQYGDNAWDKMSNRAGLGRYTRRRKWIRRAVLIEVVERGVKGPASQDATTASPTGTGTSTSTAAGMASPSPSPSPSGTGTENVMTDVQEPTTEVSGSTAVPGRKDLKERLARAAQ